MSDGSFNLIDNTDAEDEDADIFEMLGESDRSLVATPEQAALDRSLVPVPPLEHPAAQDIWSEVANLQSSPLVIIDSYPHGSPGMPVSRHLHMDNTDHEVSIWAPFASQCDWEVAHWAKMRGPTSSATADLLAVPEVWLFSL